jgi:hypothetical protein
MDADGMCFCKEISRWLAEDARLTGSDYARLASLYTSIHAVLDDRPTPTRSHEAPGGVTIVEAVTKPEGDERTWIEIGFADVDGDEVGAWDWLEPRYPHKDGFLAGVSRQYEHLPGLKRLRWRIIVPEWYGLMIARVSSLGVTEILYMPPCLFCHEPVGGRGGLSIEHVRETAKGSRPEGLRYALAHRACRDLWYAGIGEATSGLIPETAEAWRVARDAVK